MVPDIVEGVLDGSLLLSARAVMAVPVVLVFRIVDPGELVSQVLLFEFVVQFGNDIQAVVLVAERNIGLIDWASRK